MNILRRKITCRFLVFLIFGVSIGLATADGRVRMVLNGEWQVGEGSMEQAPAEFLHRVPVPGLVDMAVPAFAEVGVKSARRQAFWYRKEFRVDGEGPAVAELKIHKAAYGARVFLNGEMVGEHLSSFTPGHFDVRRFLRGAGATNVLLVRVGAFRDAVPKGIPYGWDFEKKFYTPGIFDSVELILTGAPRIVRVQAAPNIQLGNVRTMTWMKGGEGSSTGKLELVVREAKSGKVVAQGSPTGVFTLRPHEECAIELSMNIENYRLWSPEDPFLYELEVTTGPDRYTTRFGMREFRLDPPTGRAMLNGRPRFLRGSNVTLYRFFEDSQRGDKPWRAEWVRRLHRRFKEMHWDSLRYCIGFPPEMWYDIADEEGFMIQDEFPLWGLDKGEQTIPSAQLIQEYTEWVQERWNHPSVVIWDAQNETRTPETGKAIAAVRHLDFSNRPWDNGWAPPQAPVDVYESHPYLFGNSHFKLSGVEHVPGVPQGNPVPNTGKNAIIINEYGWLWLNRDGTPTTLTREVYKNLLGESATPAQRRHLYARYLTALTEFWRGRRACAGVLHFCGLGYSRPDGQTSDHFIDLEALTYEPEFFRYVRDAFAPVGLMIDHWADELNGGTERKVPVVVINDRDRRWDGQVRLRLLCGGEPVSEQTRQGAVEPLGTQRLEFVCAVPSKAGEYQMEAELLEPGAAPVRSLRDFAVLTPEQKLARDGIAVGKPATASSSTTQGGVTYPAGNAVDGSRGTRWSSDFSDPQWIAVDLGEVQEVSRVELLWETAYGKAYQIQVSSDGQQWRDVYSTTSSDGGTDLVRFEPVPARWVRMYGSKRGTQYGYSLWEFRVFEP